MKKLFYILIATLTIACSNDNEALATSSIDENPCELTMWGYSTDLQTTPPTKSILYGVTRETAVYIQVDDYNWNYYLTKWNSDDSFTCWEGIQTPPED